MKTSSVDTQALLSTEKRKFPEVFRWKVAAIIITVLIAGFVVADVIIAVYLSNNQPRNNNYTFAAEVLKTLPKTTSKRAVLNILSGLKISFKDLWYQQATLLKSWTATTTGVNNDELAPIFGDNSDQLLTFVGFKDSLGTQFVGAAYTHVAFKLPDTWKTYLGDAAKSYYTFEIDNRESVLLGGASSRFLRMSGSTNNLKNCRIIDLSQSKLTFMSAFTLDYSDPVQTIVNINNVNAPAQCFEGEPSLAQFNTDIDSMIGVGVAPLTLQWIASYHLADE